MDDNELLTLRMVNLTPMLIDALTSADGDPMIAAQSSPLMLEPS
jgi:hypothetical protein